MGDLHLVFSFERRGKRDTVIARVLNEKDSGSPHASPLEMASEWASYYDADVARTRLELHNWVGSDYSG
jgi:hypothetical protein